MVCLHLLTEKVEEDNNSYVAVYVVCKECGRVLDMYMVDKKIPDRPDPHVMGAS